MLERGALVFNSQVFQVFIVVSSNPCHLWWDILQESSSCCKHGQVVCWHVMDKPTVPPQELRHWGNWGVSFLNSSSEFMLQAASNSQRGINFRLKPCGFVSLPSSLFSFPCGDNVLGNEGQGSYVIGGNNKN